MKKQILPILCTMLMMLLLPFKMEASDSVSLKHSQTSISGIEYRVKQLEDFQRENSFFLTVSNTLCLISIGVIIYLVIVAQKNADNLEFHNKQLNAHSKQFNYLESSIIQWNQFALLELSTIMEKYITFSEREKQETINNHSIVLELSKHIVNIENNLSKMNSEDGGVKRINRAIQRIHDSFKTQEYELTALLGTELRDGQIIEIDQREHDPTIPHGKMVISNVIKAEILYKGEQIQRAKVDVKFNY